MFPESLIEIAEIIGKGAALQLANEFGGTEEYIPKTINKDHKISKCIGHDAAQILAAWAGGWRLEIPRALSVNNGIRNTEILQAVEDGQSKKSLARKYGITTRWVRKITNEVDADSDQGDLF